MVLALRTWGHYLYGVYVDVFSNHKIILCVNLERVESLPYEMARVP